ncbi:MAG: hypothetical protein SGCHY_001051 [Lobulomycetales sp.]
MSVSNEHQPEVAKHALQLAWTYGMTNVDHSVVHNLRDNYRVGVFYSSANTGIVYDYHNSKQHLLQGHCNKITATAATDDKRYLITADTGENSLLIVWDTMPRLELSVRKANAQTIYSATMANLTTFAPLPMKTLFDPHNGAGVLSVVFTPGVKQIITLGADEPQTLSIWSWSDSINTAAEIKFPVATCTISGSRQSYVQFNEAEPTEFMTTGPDAVYFFAFEEGKIHQFTPVTNFRFVLSAANAD